MLIILFLLLFTVGGLLGIILAMWITKARQQESPPPSSTPASQPKQRIPMGGTNVPIGSVAQTKFTISKGDGENNPPKR